MNTTDDKKPTPTNDKVNEEKIDKELDPDTEVHKQGSDLITKVDHHLEVDDEVKKG